MINPTIGKRILIGGVIAATAALLCHRSVAADQPNIVLVMADDQGWGQTGYYNHPILKTPHLDQMASAGLRFDRFYAGAPVCSPTRGSVLTGRANDRIGVLSHGYALRLQETTIAQVLHDAGYTTGHFGKWHLNALQGPGVPILATDDHNPGAFGFDHWTSVTNFFDRDPIMSRTGKFEEFKGDSSEIAVDLAIDFMQRQTHAQQKFLAVIWYGSPHSPFRSSDDDAKTFQDLNDLSRQHYGELVAMDRSIGTLRKAIADLEIDDNTLIWFCSDNGGLPKIVPGTVGGLRGNKGSIFEGGLRVPGIIEWPARIKPRITKFPASVLDIMPTLMGIVGVDHPFPQRPADGMDLQKIFDADLERREKPIPFRHTGKAALIDNRYKLLTTKLTQNKFQLYDLVNDPAEKNDLARERPEIAKRMTEQLLKWSQSVDKSHLGHDYPSGKVSDTEPEPRFWTDVEAYKPYFPEWKKRPEYESRLSKKKSKR